MSCHRRSRSRTPRSRGRINLGLDLAAFSAGISSALSPDSARGSARVECAGGLPDAGVRRACGGLHAVRAYGLSLPFVRRPALPRLRREQTGGLAAAPAARLVAGAVLPLGVHVAP